ncbi:putative enoyl-CoA hydratase echA8 [Corynebacterium ciconiae DSM 44920]|uniref:3-hydroxyisobutyryl-CoA hydrolase n=1 Tax=Corynebacterium ciconiae TaxID=227319 RepID=UPI000374F617|nr:3-hydroxyisobutyryl-CoA hydrolase [Corynebacterium ciconiae]WKD60287.1 putative enoyl-CoA hydratase echA8 [Corynebacterium ciconiae DSM 44920]
MVETVLYEQRGRASIITLNRPRAINALSLEMVRRISQLLRRSVEDEGVDLVLLRGTGERGLCAGGDIVDLYHDARAGGSASAQFWSEEYSLNLQLARCPLPVVAIQHGLVLGGGVGVSGHASHRIVSDSTALGLTQTAIGLVPDTGSSYLLARGDYATGAHLALTGQHAGPAEAIEAGLADYYVPQSRLEQLCAELIDSGDPSIIAECAVPAPVRWTLGTAQRCEIYTPEASPAEILRRLAACGAAGAEAAERIRSNSPLAVAITAELLRRARTMSLEDVLDLELCVSLHMQRCGEFIEGVRALLVDKDHAPSWRHAAVENVHPAEIEAACTLITDPTITYPSRREGEP